MIRMHNHRVVDWLVLLAVLQAWQAGAEAPARPAISAEALASKVFPGHELLLLPVSRTSQLQAALRRRQAERPGAPVLVLLSGRRLLVDRALAVGEGQALMLATPAALRAAAAALDGGSAAPAGPRLPPADLLTVDCRGSADGSFVQAKGAASLALLGLAVADCPGTALSVEGGGRLLLQDVRMARNNHGGGGAEMGGAVLADGVGQVELVHVACDANYAVARGGCLHCQRVQGVRLARSTFSSNWKDQSYSSLGMGGGAVSLELASQAAVVGCSFSNNTADGDNGLGGALLASNGGHIRVANSSFDGNRAVARGGAVAARDVASLVVTDSNFTANGELPPEEQGGEPGLTIRGGAVCVIGMRATHLYAANATVARCRFSRNAASLGASVYMVEWGRSAGSLAVADSVFEHNRAPDGEGAAIYVEEGLYSEVRVGSCAFRNNSGLLGGAVSTYDTALWVADSTFEGNTATELDGGAVSATTYLGSGDGNVTLRRCTFANNTSGGQGGAVAVDRQGLVMEGVELLHNEAAGDGGAVSVASSPLVVLADATVAGNTAKQGGGGLAARTVDHLTVVNVTLRGNQGAQGGGLLLSQVRQAALSGTALTSNSATEAGGGAAVLGAGALSWSDGAFVGNIARLGGGLAADSSTLVLEGVGFADNVAATEVPLAAAAGAPAVSARRKLRQAATSVQAAANAPGPTAAPFASLVHAAGSGGAGLVQRSSLALRGCRLQSNVALWDGGGLLAPQPLLLDASGAAFLGNRAQRGVGGALAVRGIGSAPGRVAVSRCSFSGNAAGGGSGGAAVLDSGLGPLQAAFESCQFDGNSAGASGGGVAAVGPTALQCANCSAGNNTAGHSGGWVHCVGCISLALTGSTGSGNQAAVAGGAVAVEGAAEVQVSDCSLASNSAGAALGRAEQGADNLDLLGASWWPLLWQRLYGSTAAEGAGSRCADGAGGGLCLGDVRLANVARTSFACNAAARGGGLFASAACRVAEGAAAPGGGTDGSAGQGCGVALAGVSAVGNVARAAGGGIFVGTPDSVALGGAPGSGAGAEPVAPPAGSLARATPLQQHRAQELVAALGRNNSVMARGYGAGAASAPVRLSLMHPDLHAGAAARGGAQQQCSGLKGGGVRGGGAHGAGGRRRLLFDLTQVIEASKPSTTNLASKRRSLALGAVEGAAEFGLPHTCPPLGATVLGQQRVGVSSSQVFALPVFLLDAFGGQVTSGQASEWRVQLKPLSGSVPLSGAARGRLAGGAAVLDGLSLSEPPNTTRVMQLLALYGSEAQLSSDVVVEVRPCLPGQAAKRSPSPAAGGAAAAAAHTCSDCPAPLFSFTAYAGGGWEGSGGTSSSSSGGAGIQQQACQHCPQGGWCVAGMLIPAPGSYQPHLRSAAIRPCPNPMACQRDESAQQNLLGLQCASRAFVNASDVDPAPFTALQCTRGYAGPLCSCCYRPGRAGALRLAAPAAARPGAAQLRGRFTFASEGPALVADRSGFELAEAFGAANRRCGLCPHIAIAWLRFLLARLVDVAFVALLALLWASLGRLSAAAEGRALERLARPWTASHTLSSLASVPLSVASEHVGRVRSLTGTGALPGGGAPPPATPSCLATAQWGEDEELLQLTGALLLLAVKHLACVAQVVLDGAQVAAVLLSLDMLFLLPDWAATGMSAALMTQATTWQWVAFECLLPASSPVSAAVVETALALVLPGLYTAAVFPLLLWLRRPAGRYLGWWPGAASGARKQKSVTFCASVAQTASGAQADEATPEKHQQQQQKQQQGKQRRQRRHSGQRRRPHPRNAWRLLATASVASMAYVYSFYVAHVVGALSCVPLGGRPTVPGEVHLRGSRWAPDMQLTCWRGQHLAAAVPALLVGVPSLLGYWWLLLVLAWPPPARSGGAAAAGLSGALAVALSSSAAHLAHPAHWLQGLPLAACGLLDRTLGPAVRRCQALAAAAGVSGRACAALGVWSAEWRWWWLPARELVKAAIVLVAAATALRAPPVQAQCVLLLVILSALLTRIVDPGCTTSMERMLFAANAWLMLLALLVVSLVLAGVGAAAGGAVLLLVVAAAAAATAGTTLVVSLHCLRAARDLAGMNRPGPDEAGEGRACLGLCSGRGADPPAAARGWCYGARASELPGTWTGCCAAAVWPQDPAPFAGDEGGRKR